MAEAFNPYHVWLSIPPEEQPANYYRLLSLPLLESNPDVIDNAADRQTAHLRTFQSGKNGKFAERLLNEVAAARVCLLDPKKKAAYDQRIQAWLAAQKAKATGSQQAAPQQQQAAAKPSAGDWDNLLGDVASKPQKSVGSRQGAVGGKQKAKQRPLAIFAVAGVLLLAAVGIGIYALNSKPADGTLALDWPADQREGATLTIDDAQVSFPAGATIERAAPPGEHRLTATRPLYQPWSATVTVAAGERQAVAIEWKPKAVVAFDWPVKDRAGAELKIDGKSQPLTDHEPLELLVEPGEHTIRITRPNAEPVQTGVQVALGGRRTIAIAPAAADTTLLVQWPAADRTGAHLLIDGAEPVLAKSSPETLEFTLKTGRHTVRITRPGFQPIEQSVDLAAADNKPLVLTWTPEVATNTQPTTPDPGAPGPTPTSPESPNPAAENPPAKKRSVPTADEQAKIAKQLDELYKPTHTAADAAKANEFYDLADKAQSPAERYMLLAKGAELAAGAGDAALAFSGVDLLAAEYEIEPFEVKQKLLDKAVVAAATAEQTTQLVAAAELLLDQAVAADQYGAAMAIAATASKALGKRPVDAQLRKDTDDLLARRRRDIHILEPLYAAAQKAQKALDASPADADAILTVGRWYCLYKNDWPRGLPLLAKGKDEKLKAAALAELKPPATTDEQVQAADGWWDISQKELGLAHDAIRSHAGDLYTAALPGINSSIAKIKIDKRLAEIANLQVPAATFAAGRPSVPLTFPRGQWVDVLRLVDPARDTVKGHWSRHGTEVSCEPEIEARIELPVVIDGSYDLDVEFTRTSGGDDVDTIIPVGSRGCSVVMSAGGNGNDNGLALIDGRRPFVGNNLTGTHYKLENGRRYRLSIRVRLPKPGQASTDVALDRTPFLPHWEGSESSLSIPDGWALAHTQRAGLATWNARVTYHTVRLRMISGRATSDASAADIPSPTNPPAAKPVALPRGQWVDVLKLVDANRDNISGKWSRNGTDVVSEQGEANRLELPVNIDGGYDLEVEFTRTDGTADVNTLFPVGSRLCNATLSGDTGHGPGSGLDTLDGRDFPNPQNPTSKHPGGLENDHRYRLLLSVRPLPDHRVSIDVALDGQPYLPHWTGGISSLGVRDAWSLPDPKRPGLGVYESRVIFHSVRLRMISGQATTDATVAAVSTPTKPATKPVAFPHGQWVDVLGLVDLPRNAVKGDWSRSGAEISCEAGDTSRLELPLKIDGDYDLQVELTRTEGNGDINTFFTVGPHQCMFMLDGYNGSLSALDVVDGHLPDNPLNPTAKHSDALENGRRYQILLSVRRPSADHASVDVSLDGKPFLPHWEGNPASLTPHTGWWAMPHADWLGLGVFKSKVTFHSVRLRMLSGQATPDAAKAADSGNAPAAGQRTSDVGALPAEEQVAAVVKKLEQLNPGFDGTEAHKIENGVVTEFKIATDNVSDISPLQALTGLKRLTCGGSAWNKQGKVTDLSALKQMKLEILNCPHTPIADLSPLAGMPLIYLNCNSTAVADLTPLRGMPLAELNLGGTQVADLAPLAGLPLTKLAIDNTPVADLAPLAGLPLVHLSLERSKVTDLSALQRLSLEHVAFTPANIAKGIDLLRQMKSVTQIGTAWNAELPPEEFWKKYDAGEFK